MHLRRTLGIGLGLFAVAAFAVAQQAGRAKGSADGRFAGRRRRASRFNPQIPQRTIQLCDRRRYWPRTERAGARSRSRACWPADWPTRSPATKSLMSDKEIKETMVELQKLVATQRSEARAKLAERNKGSARRTRKKARIPGREQEARRGQNAAPAACNTK